MPVFTRSLINCSIAEATKAFARFGIVLPPWAFLSPSEWAGKGEDWDEIREDEPPAHYLCHEYPAIISNMKGNKHAVC